MPLASATSSAAKPARTGRRMPTCTDWSARRGNWQPRRPPALSIVDDATGREGAASITEATGVFTGKIEELLDHGQAGLEVRRVHRTTARSKPVIGLTHHA